MRLISIFFFFVISSIELLAFDYPLRDTSVAYRGILSTTDSQIPVNVFVKVGKTIRILMSGEFGSMVKLELSKKGSVMSLEVGSFMSKFDAQNFFLPDVMACMGFTSFFYPEVVHSFVDSQGRVSKILSLDSHVEIDFYYQYDSSSIKRIFIKRKNYILDLTTVDKQQ